MNNSTSKLTPKNLFFVLLLYFTHIPLNLTASSMLKSTTKTSTTQNQAVSVITPRPISAPGQKNFFDIYQPVCSNATCPMPRSYCTSAQNCHCNTGYADFTPPDSTPSNIPCQYKQKKQIVAFLLEFFFPFGVGHLYSKRMVYGIIKLLFVLATPCLMCCMVCCGIFTMDSLFSQKVFSTLSATVGLLYTIGVMAWLVCDLVLFGLNKYNDGYGVPLQEW